MAQDIKKVECDPACGFMIRSHDDREIVDIVKAHAKKAHNMTITDKDVRDKMKAA